MQIKPICSDKDHAAALVEIERLWGAKRGSPDGDKLDVLGTLVEAYERERFPIDRPDAIEAIRFRLERQGKDLRSLVGVIGQRTRVYEVMRGDRPRSLAMIRRLNKKLGIPAEVLIHSGKRAHRKPSALGAVKPSRRSA
jgi:HTH-type transcriptional regulator / antitoxin HigA